MENASGCVLECVCVRVCAGGLLSTGSDNYTAHARAHARAHKTTRFTVECICHALTPFLTSALTDVSLQPFIPLTCHLFVSTLLFLPLLRAVHCGKLEL